jgi:hypothetical protein
LPELFGVPFTLSALKAFDFSQVKKQAQDLVLLPDIY